MKASVLADEEFASKFHIDEYEFERIEIGMVMFKELGSSEIWYNIDVFKPYDGQANAAIS